MELNDLILISTDDHIIEPPDVFKNHIASRWQESAPHMVRRADGSDVWLYEGVELTTLALNAVAGWPVDEWGIEPASLSQLREGTYDVASRVMDMNANGVLASMGFPTFPQFCGQVFLRSKDKELGLATVRAYNDWHIEEWCGYAPERFIPLGLLPLWDPELMAAEVRRLDKLGCHAVTFSENPVQLGLPSLHSTHWDPFWRACDEVGTIICMHLGSSSTMMTTSPDAPINVMMTLAPVNLISAATDLIYSPVLRNYSNLKVALSEGGVGWIPFFLERIDYEYRTHRAWTHMDFGSRLPSEIFRERVITCFINDPHGVAERETIGIDNMTWECDYPHSDSTWPRSPETVHEQFAGVSDEDTAKITHQNAMNHWRFDPFALRPREKCTVGALRAESADWNIEPVSRRGSDWHSDEAVTTGALLGGLQLGGQQA